MDYLVRTYETTKFNTIQEIVKELDKELNGKIIISKYQESLKSSMTSEEIKADLYLFITLLRIQQRIN